MNGQEIARLPFNEPFDNASLDPWWSTRSTGSGRIQVLSGDVRLDDAGAYGAYARNELTLRISLAGHTNVVLRFRGSGYLVEQHAEPPVPFLDGADYDGLALSEDGVRWFPILNLSGLPWFGEVVVLNLDEEIARYGLSYNSDFQIRFTQYGHSPIHTDGMRLDDIIITGTPSTVPLRFEWSPSLVWHPSGIPLPMVIRAVNGGGSVVTGYQGSANLSAFASGAYYGDLIVGNGPFERRVGGTVPITRGFVFEPQTNVVVTHFRNFHASKVSIWAEDGLLLTSSPTLSSSGDWSETSLNAPVELRAGERYRIGFQGTITALSAQFVSPRTDGALKIVQGCYYEGDSFPFLLEPVGFQLPFVGLRYRTGSLQSVPITPTAPVTFTNGLWSGIVTVPEPHGMLHLVASDGARVLGSTRSFAIEPWLPLAVVLPQLAREGDGVLPNRGQIVLSYPATNDVAVHLTVVDSNEVTVPASILIPAGQTNGLFDVTVVDDALFDARRIAYVEAWAMNHQTNFGFMFVDDNEPAQLRVVLPPAVPEGGGVLMNVGRVELNGPAAVGLFVGLVNSNTSALSIPSSVYLPSGATSALFSLNVFENNLLGGVDVNVAAFVTGWTSGIARVTVTDNEGTNLMFRLLYEQKNFSEGAGTVSGALQLYLGGRTTSNTVFSLESSDLTELTVPATATVLQGASNVVIPFTLVNDSELDGRQTVVITAAAPGFGTGSTNLVVDDNDLHHFNFGPLGSVQTSTVPFQVRITARTIDDLPVREMFSPLSLSATGEVGRVEITPTTLNIVNEAMWQANITILNGAHTNVRIIVSDGAGHSVESSPFDVIAGNSQLLRLRALRVVGNDVELEFTTVAGRHYRIEYASRLDAPEWDVVARNFTGTGDIMRAVHTNGVAPTQGFYRARLEP